MHGGQLFDGLDEFELVVIHQEVDSVAVRAATEAVIKLFFAVYGERRGFFIMEGTARVVVLALLLELYPCVYQVDDIGASQQIIDKDTWDSSSHKPRFYQPINENKPRIPFGSTASTTTTLSVSGEDIP
ncbi:hypothetical protein BN133_2498 [Cronobacter dublinensis 582]|nr:hypothetical protein BN133_2498 [Cronobacter dublinensis 582]